LKQLENILAEFDPLSLSEMNDVKLMNRIDRKYWFHSSCLEELLEKSVKHYDILEINGKRLMEYHSVYFDTKDNRMYLEHHNKKLNRYKVRRRTYLETGDHFFEIKLKTNKKRTIKKRIATISSETDIFKKEINFLKRETSFDKIELMNSLNNRFFRMTLIHKQKQERCTIDIHPEFWKEGKKLELKNLVIFELKKGRSLKGSPMVSMLREMKIRQSGLSKYCTGRAFLEPELKRNAFKSRLRFIEKNILN
jgi:hypothetical protein